MTNLTLTAFSAAPLGSLSDQLSPWVGALVLAIFIVIQVKLGITASLIALCLAGVAQNPLITWTGLEAFRWADDLGLGVIAVFLLVGLLRRRLGWAHLIPLGIAVLLVGIQASRSPTLESAVFQARQFIVPVVLMTIGWSMSRIIKLTHFSVALMIMSILVEAYMLAEAAIGAPLMDPTYTFLLDSPAQSMSLRDGLPPAYFSDLPGGIVWFRPGGPFFNAPIAGIFLASGVYAAMTAGPRVLRILTITLALSATCISLSRAGLILSLVLTLGWVFWRYFGKRVAAVTAALVGIASAFVFWPQGNTSSHATGLFAGLVSALTRPWGDGLGTQGFFAELGAGESSESLLGVAFATLGIAPVLVVGALIIVLVLFLIRQDRRRALPGIFLLGALFVCAFSESVGALQGSAAFWLFAGLAVRTVLKSVGIPPSPTDRPLAF